MLPRLPLMIGVVALALAAAHSVAAAAWLGPTIISAQSSNPVQPATSSTGLSMAVADDGAVTALWAQTVSGQVNDSAYSARMVDGAWGAPAPISSPGLGVVNPHVAVGPTGNAIATWNRGAFGARVVQGMRYSGGRWTGETTLAPAGDNGTDVMVAADGADSCIAMWTHLVSGTDALQWSRYSGGGWVRPRTCREWARSPRRACSPPAHPGR